MAKKKAAKRQTPRQRALSINQEMKEEGEVAALAAAAEQAVQNEITADEKKSGKKKNIPAQSFARVAHTGNGMYKSVAAAQKAVAEFFKDHDEEKAWNLEMFSSGKDGDVQLNISFSS